MKFYNRVTVNLQCVTVNLQWPIVNPLKNRKRFVNLTVKYTSASRKRVTQEKLEHKSPLCICDTVELNTLFKNV